MKSKRLIAALAIALTAGAATTAYAASSTQMCSTRPNTSWWVAIFICASLG